MIISDEYFEEAIRAVLDHEGDYSDNPLDDGGETKFGISKSSYPLVDIANLTLEKAKAIYKKDFWKPYFSKINDRELRIKFFDLSVNMGLKMGTRLIQRALRSTYVRVEEDGICGKQTVAAINNADSTDLLAALKSEGAGYYRALARIDSKDKIFLEGWLNRAYA